MDCQVEFFVQPFREANPGAHVTKAIEAMTANGFEVEVGPFGNQTAGPLDQVAEAIAAMLVESFLAGASRIAVTVSAVDQ